MMEDCGWIELENWEEWDNEMPLAEKKQKFENGV